jgi:hypothetical protein
VTILALLLLAQTASAHNGPPFPILVDQKVDPYLISVWADPNVGAASTFFVIVNPPAGGSIPNDLKIDIGVQPVNGRLAEVFYSGEREDLRGQIQYKAIGQLDAQEFWRVRIRLKSAQGSGELMTTVEATPVGYGRWDILLYLLPFVVVGVLWLLAVARRRLRASQAKPDPAVSENP